MYSNINYLLNFLKKFINIDLPQDKISGILFSKSYN